MLTMSYYYQFDDKRRILLAVQYGHVDDTEARQMYLDIRRRKDEEHALTCILDLTPVTKFDVSTQTVRDLAYLPPNFTDPTLRAVVAPTDFLFGMARMFQIRGSETREELHIVRTLGEALTLLDAEEAQFHKLRTA